MLRGRHIIRVRLAAAAIALLGLAGAAALTSATAHSGTAGATPGVPARARASAPRILAARPGIATTYVVNAVGHGDTDRYRDQQSRTRHQDRKDPCRDRDHAMTGIR
jgi:hypothetical protein